MSPDISPDIRSNWPSLSFSTPRLHLLAFVARCDGQQDARRYAVAPVLVLRPVSLSVPLARLSVSLEWNWTRQLEGNLPSSTQYGWGALPNKGVSTMTRKM